MKNQRGFILPLTLWILAVIAIVAGIFAERMLAALDLAKSGQRRVQDLIDINNTRSEILFRLGTTPMSLYGLGPTFSRAIALDDRPYQGEGRSLIRLQDDRGLLNLNLADEERLHRLLGVFNIPFDQRGRLIDTFYDYKDEDDFRRLNGAEAKEYAAAELPPPRNENLVSPYEALNILGWRDFPQLWDKNGLAELTVIGTSVGLNPNTAPWQVLATLPGVTNESALRMQAARLLGPIQTPDQAAEIMGVPAASLFLQVIPFPSDSVRITHSIAGQAWALRYNLNLTPYDERSPWRIDYQYRIPLPYKDENTGSLPNLPEKSTLPADSATPLLPF